MTRDLSFGIASLALAAGYYQMASALPQSDLADAVGPQGLPRIYSLLLAALSLILIVRSLSGGRGKGEGRAFRWSDLGRAAGLLAMGVIYVLVVPWLGYVLSIAALIAAAVSYQTGILNRQIAIVAISGAAVFWIVFVLILGIPHPPGLWPSLF